MANAVDAPGNPGGRAPQNTLADGVVVLAPIELSDAETVMAWDADPEVQRWFDWPLTPAVDDPGTYALRLAWAEQTVRNKWTRWAAGVELVFVIRSVETGEGLGWID